MYICTYKHITYKQAELCMYIHTYMYINTHNKNTYVVMDESMNIHMSHICIHLGIILAVIHESVYVCISVYIVFHVCM